MRVISGRVRKSVSTGGSVDRVVTRYGNIQGIHLVFPRTCSALALPRHYIRRCRFSSIDLESRVSESIRSIIE